MPWPAIGPDLNPMDGTIPALVRFYGGNSTVTKPQPPTNPRVQGP